MFGGLAAGLAGGMTGGTEGGGINGIMMAASKFGGMGAGGQHAKANIDSLPDKVLLKVFTFLSHREIVAYSLVCKKWHMLAQDPRLWTFVSLRPEVSGLHVDRQDTMLRLIPTKFPNLRYLELATELITPMVLQDLAKKCAELSHLYLDFSQASQLHDFTDLSAFPTKLRFMCICLSDVIFLDNFMKRIYSFINGVESLHIVGTYERGDVEEEGEVYEVVNIKTLKQATPNLRIITLWGIGFLDDSHIEAFSSNCIQLQVLNVCYCSRVRGACLKILLQRCKNLRCLLLNQTNLESEYVMSAEWEKAEQLQELDITATDVSKECLLDVLPRIPAIRWLAAGQLDGFTDQVMKNWMEHGNLKELRAIDLDSSDNLSEEMLQKFITVYGPQLHGLSLSGMTQATDVLWNSVLQKLPNARILIMGTERRMSIKIHVDHLIDAIAKHCSQLQRLEFRWDNDTLRFSDKNQKAIDLIRARCLRLQSLVLCDGKLYEIMWGNFERADRRSVIRTSINCRVRINYLLSHYEEMLFT